jgi:hypothetical protein
MVLKWKIGRELNDDLNLRSGGQLAESGVSLDGKGREWFVDIRGSKVVAAACVD